MLVPPRLGEFLPLTGAEARRVIGGGSSLLGEEAPEAAPCLPEEAVPSVAATAAAMALDGSIMDLRLVEDAVEVEEVIEARREDRRRAELVRELTRLESSERKRLASSIGGMLWSSLRASGDMTKGSEGL